MATIAWISSETPDDRGGGGQRRQFHQIRELLQRGIGVHVATLESPQRSDGVARLAPVVRYEPGGLRGRRASRSLERFLSSDGFDGAVVAHVESLTHAGAALRRAGIPWLLDVHNVHSRYEERIGRRRAARAHRAAERRALRRADAAIACSDEEAAALRALGTGTRVEVAGHGIAAEEWPDGALAAEREPIVAFFGSLGHRPNAEGLEWLARRIWPSVLRSAPWARLEVLGPGEPPAAVCAADGIVVHGRVDDLAAALGRALVVAVPILRGVGARVKFGEGLASGAAVVSTSVGAEGFDGVRCFVRSDGEDAFAQALTELLREPARAVALGAAGRAHALERLTWSRTTEPLAGWVAEVGR